VKRRSPPRWQPRGGPIVAPDPRAMLGLAAPPPRARWGVPLAIALSIALHAAGVAWVARSAPAPVIEPAPMVVSILREPGPPPLAEAPTPVPPAPPKVVPPPPKPAPKVVAKPPVRAAVKPAPTPAPAPTAPAPAATASASAPAAESTPPVSAGVPSGVAAGAGGGADAIQAYVASVLRRIDAKKRYPSLAKSRGVEGTVMVTLWISPGGGLDRVEIADKAPPLLAASTREAVEKASPFPPPPNGMPSIRVPIRYALR
jgi:protein TonB